MIILDKNITKDQERMRDLMESILDVKDRIQGLEIDLDNYKNNLLDLMKKNNTYEIESYTAKANIIEFNRESLDKDKTIDAINKVNKGLKEKVDISGLINRSNVCFVLVKEL
ncbi:hypothetical protein HMPREF1092_03277 [Clostridium thermobutyricum]|uniref:Uncharacterized protein n=1 Tax=Clostridium thermobutyricum TaxID=29372 RepID=N9W788_9CLOT|nr:hypothetical protein [Clostridium thermobutyricum]ENY98719.1 hypothetical protein HMPREF1092_03277 [Clostridium thermobutyricum]